MKRLLQISMLLSFVVGPVVLLQGQAEHLQREIGKIIRHEAHINFNLVPGLLVGVMDGDSTYTFSIGQKQNKWDSYEIGSITKPFMAWLVARAVDSLGWSMETKVCAFLPDSLCRNGWEQLTIDQLLSHRTGLMRLPPGIGEVEVNIDDPYAAYTPEAMAEDIALMSPQPGSYSYSHVNYMVLDWLFEKVGGIDAFLQQELIQPLSLTQTGFSIPDEQLAAGHDKQGSTTTPWHCNALDPALGLKSGLLDLLTMVSYISPDLIKHCPAWSPDRVKEIDKQIKQGVYDLVGGWFLIPDRETWIFYHSGFTGGHNASIAFSPGKRKGAIVLANGTLGSGELSLLILEMLLKSGAE